jgi:hypothetical protein
MGASHMQMSHRLTKFPHNQCVAICLIFFPKYFIPTVKESLKSADSTGPLLLKGNQNWNIFYFFAYWRGKSFNLLLLPSTSKAEEEKEEMGRSIEMRNIVSDGAVGWGGALKWKEKKFNSYIFFPPFLRRRKAKKKSRSTTVPKQSRFDSSSIVTTSAIDRPFFFGIFLSDHFLFFVERNLGFKFPSPCHLLIWNFFPPFYGCPPFSYLNKSFF